jgi:hypothetical protein
VFVVFKGLPQILIAILFLSRPFCTFPGRFFPLFDICQIPTGINGIFFAETVAAPARRINFSSYFSDGKTTAASIQ